MTHPLRPGEHRARVNGQTLRYRVAGRGPVLVVQSPGWGPAAAPYEPTLRPLEEDFTLVYYDPRGSGASSRPTAAADLHVGAFVADLEALRAHLGLETFALMGHSHGGLIALHYALAHPRRVAPLVLLAAQLVGVEPHPGERNGEVDPAEVPEVARAYAFLEEVGGFAAAFHAGTDADATAFLRGIAPLYFKDPAKAGPLHDFLAVRDIPATTLRAVSAADHRYPLPERALRDLRVRTLVVSGRFDLFCPPAPARRLAETLPDAERVVFEESGHFPWLEEPEAFFAEVRRFLARRSVIPAK